MLSAAGTYMASATAAFQITDVAFCNKMGLITFDRIFYISEYKTNHYFTRSIEQPFFRIPNILSVYIFIDFFVKHIFFEARLERVIALLTVGPTFHQAKNKLNKILL